MKKLQLSLFEDYSEFNDLVDKLEKHGIIKLQTRIMSLEINGHNKTDAEKGKLLLLKGDLKRRISRLEKHV